ncbi:MAG: SulP family inorganic anion transporter [Acidiferrobacterales bacterium]
MRNWMPIIKWLPDYQRSWLRGDLIAGATVWAVLIPTALAYSGLVGVDPVVGLYTVPLALLAYAIFGGSRLLVVGPDAAVAVLAGATVAAVVVGDNHLELAIALALMVGGIYMLFFFLRLGWIADLIPDPILKGVIEGLVWVTILKQVPKLFGLKLDGEAERFIPKLIELFEALPQTHIMTAIVGVLSMVALLLIHRFASRLPGPLIVLVVSIVLVDVLGLGDRGVAVLGVISDGSMRLGFPTGLDAGQIVDLLPGALAIVVLGFTLGIAAAKRAAEKTGDQIDPDQELLAIGASNLGAGLSGGYAVTGTMSKTAVAMESGGKTQIGNLFTGLLGVFTILFLVPFFASLADATLAALVIVVLLEISDVGYFLALWRVRRLECVLGVAAFAGVLAFDVMAGVMIGVVLALFKLAHHVHSPTTAVVGRTPSGAFVDVGEHEDAREIPGMLIWRQYAPLVFLNARVLSNELRRLALGREGLRVVVLDATASSGIDSTAATAFIAARDDLAAAGIALWVVNVRETAWELVVAALKAAGGAIPPVFESLADAVARFEQFGTAEGGSDD